jgi:hypothetical protein
MTNNQYPMANAGHWLAIGHWLLVIGHCGSCVLAGASNG